MYRPILLLLIFLFFAQATQAQDIAEKYYAKGVEFQELRVYTRAIDYYSAALDKKSDHLEARYNRALVYFQLAKYHKALFDIRTLVDKYPMDPDLYSLTGLIYSKLNNPTKANYYINRAIDIDDQPVFHLRKADILLQNGEPEKAFNQLSFAITEPGLEITALELKALAYIDLNQPNQAVGTYSRLINLNPHPEYYYNRGILRKQQKNFAGACLDFEEAAKESFFEEALDELIRCQWKAGDTKATEQTGKNGIIHFPNNPTFYLFSGLVALKKGKNELAFQWFDRAEQLGLSGLDLYVNKGLALIHTDKNKAKELFLLALKINPENRVALHNLELLKSWVE